MNNEHERIFPSQLFPLGRLYITCAAAKRLTASDVSAALACHAQGDWGDVDDDVAEANEDFLMRGESLYSKHVLSSGAIWVVTEGDRSATTVGLWNENMCFGSDFKGIRMELDCVALSQQKVIRTKSLFRLGSIVITENAYTAVEGTAIQAAILRHATGDWADVDDDIREENEIALLRGLKLVSVHHDSVGTEFRVVTASDRSATAVYLSHEHYTLAAEPPPEATECWAECSEGVEFSIEATSANIHPNDVDAAVALHEKTCRITANKHLRFKDVTKRSRRCYAASLCRGRDGIEFIVYTSRAGKPPRIILPSEEEAKGVYVPTDADTTAVQPNVKSSPECTEGGCDEDN